MTFQESIVVHRAGPCTNKYWYSCWYWYKCYCLYNTIFFENRHQNWLRGRVVQGAAFRLQSSLAQVQILPKSQCMRYFVHLTFYLQQRFYFLFWHQVILRSILSRRCLMPLIPTRVMRGNRAVAQGRERGFTIAYNCLWVWVVRGVNKYLLLHHSFPAKIPHKHLILFHH